MSNNFNPIDDLHLTEEVHYPSRCQFPDCLDDIIPNPTSNDRYCFKHTEVDPNI